MAMVRSAAFGIIAGLGVPMLLRNYEEPLGDFVESISESYQVADIYLRFSWPIFAVVTFLTFILLAVTRDR